MTNYPSMDRLADVQKFIADFAKVTRAVPLATTNTAENDVEHSYGLAMTAWFLHSHIAPELDLAKILQYALAHDVVEIHAGDTYVFDAAAVATKDIRERDALEQLRTEWPDFTEMTDATAAYADKRNEEARFVYAIDKLLPIIMIELDDAKTIWQHKQVTLAMERAHKKTILQSDIVAPYYEKLLSWLDERDNIEKN